MGNKLLHSRVFFSKNPSLCKARNLRRQEIWVQDYKAREAKGWREILAGRVRPSHASSLFLYSLKIFLLAIACILYQGKNMVKGRPFDFWVDLVRARIFSGDRNFSPTYNCVFRRERYSFQCRFFPLKSVCRISSGESLRFQLKTVQSFKNHSGYSIFQFENNVNFVKRDNDFTSLFGSTRKMGLIRNRSCIQFYYLTIVSVSYWNFFNGR